MTPPDRKDPARGASRRARLRERLETFVVRDLWRPDLAGLTAVRSGFYRVSRVLVLVQRGFVRHRCPFHAAALTYVTVLSLVPFLAFAFSVAKGLGAYERLLESSIHPFLDRTFGAAGSGEQVEIRAAIDKILSFVEATNVSSLGIFGLAFLLYTVVKLLGNIELSFNEIWGVRRSRSLARKLTDYVAMVVITPILLTAATGINAAAQAGRVMAFLEERLGLRAVIELLFSLTPLVATWVALAFLYFCLPSTRPRVKSAIVGGVVAGTLWQIVQLVAFGFQMGVARYNAIYSGFAAIPLLMIWIYLSWLTVLFGAELAAAHQREPSLRGSVRLEGAGLAWRERLALRACAHLAACFLKGETPISAERLGRDMGVAQATLDEILADLARAGLLARARSSRHTGYLPARSIERITAAEVLLAVRGGAEPVSWPPRHSPEERADRALEGLRGDLERSPHNLTLRQLASDE